MYRWPVKEISRTKKRTETKIEEEKERSNIEPSVLVVLTRVLLRRH